MTPCPPPCPARSFKLAGPKAPLAAEQLPMVRGLDSHVLKEDEFIAGTDGCDIWEVDKDPRVLVEVRPPPPRPR